MLLVQQLIYISCLMGPQQQASSSRLASVGLRWDRQMDSRDVNETQEFRV